MEVSWGGGETSGLGRRLLGGGGIDQHGNDRDQAKAVHSEPPRASQSLSLVFGRDSEAGREALQWTKGKVQTCPSRPGEAGGGSWKRASYVISLGSIFGFLWLALNWKQGQN